MDYPEPVVSDLFRSAFVDEQLFVERLGGSKSDPDAVKRYLSLPIAARPEISVFFDRDYYWERYPDLRAVPIDPLAHFIKHGVREGRTPHPLIDIAFMKSFPELLPDPVTIDALYAALSQDVADPSSIFSLDYYRSQLDGSMRIKGGLLRHFLEMGILLGFKPSPAFDPIAHYYRDPRRTFDIRSGLRAFASRGGQVQDEHGEPATEDQARSSFLQRAQSLQLTRNEQRLRFGYAGQPDISVIMAAHDNFELTLLALSSLRTNYPGPIQLILVDSGSLDETRNLAEYIVGADLLRFDTDIGFVRACNAGLTFVLAETVLYLNNTVELARDAVPAALRRLQSDVAIGAVGGKIVGTHGLLQEAGCILWRDGRTMQYQRDQSPLVPEVNFVRDVDFCSSVFLLTRTSLLRDLGGFSGAFGAASFEDADLCVRIEQAGYRIVYDPAIVVTHLDHPASQYATNAHQQTQRAHSVFSRTHEQRLQGCYTSDSDAQLLARSVGEVHGRVLFIEDHLPLRRLGSGFVRSNDIIHLMARMGHHVTVYPIRHSNNSLAAVYADFPDNVEVMHDRSLEDLGQFLTTRRGYYDTIWVARTHNLDLIKPVLERCGHDARVVLDTEAIAAPREALRLATQGITEPFDVNEATAQELRNAGFCQNIVAVSAMEAECLQQLGFHNVDVLGHMRPLALTPRSWGERSGLLFVGSVMTMDSPNYDSLCWFVDEVLPLIEQTLGWRTRLTIAGFVSDDATLDRFRGHARVTLRGAVADLAPLYDAHRVFIAPTRYAAGLPYKICEAASFGLPVAASELLRRQLGWSNEQDILAADSADPAAFARQVLALYQSEPLWRRIRAGAAERIRTECGDAACEQVLSAILRSPSQGCFE